MRQYWKIRQNWKIEQNRKFDQIENGIKLKTGQNWELDKIENWTKLDTNENWTKLKIGNWIKITKLKWTKLKSWTEFLVFQTNFKSRLTLCFLWQESCKLRDECWKPSFETDETWVKPHQSCGVIAVFNTQELLFQLLTKVKELLLLISLPVSQGKSPKFAYFMLETSSLKKTFEVQNMMCFRSILFFFSLCLTLSNLNFVTFYPVSILRFCPILHLV